MVLSIASQIGVSPTQTHVAYVHFSSADRTGVLVNLAASNTYDEFVARVESLNIGDVLGDTDVFE